jgi:hypothetical protein
VAALNDFDVLVVGGPDVSKELAGASAALAARVGLDFLDLAWTDGAWADVPATMLNLDIRYGSQVIRGAADVLDRMPTIAAADITMHDAMILLINRIGGLLSGSPESVLCSESLDSRTHRYLVNQVVKALVAVGDTHLVEWHAYDASYRGRRERFACLAPGAGIADTVREAVDCAYRLKVWPDVDELSDPVRAAMTAAPLVLSRLRGVAEVVFGKSCRSECDLASLIRGVGGDWVRIDNERLCGYPEIASRLVSDQPQVSIRQEVYAAMPLLLRAMTRPSFDPSEPAGEVSSWLGRSLCGEHDDSWESVRSNVVAVWLAMNH